MHGEGGLAADSPLLAALARGRHVVAPLLPGYGLSSGAEGLRDMLAATLHSFDVLEVLGLDRPALVGHSMGGMIAAEMAALAPREVERLGLIAPMGLWLDAHAARPVLDAAARASRPLVPRPGIRRADHDRRPVLEAFVIGIARQRAMASKLLFPLPIAASPSVFTGFGQRP